MKNETNSDIDTHSDEDLGIHDKGSLCYMLADQLFH